MINIMKRRANIGEIACFQDAQTGDYSLSLHGAIAELTAENQRLQVMIDDLRNKIECLHCGVDLHELGYA
jgi:hypothetical protein